MHKHSSKETPRPGRATLLRWAGVATLCLTVTLAAATLAFLSYVRNLAPKPYGVPAPLAWVPEPAPPGMMVPPAPLAANNSFRTLHSDTRCSDEIATAVAPLLAVDWTMETDLFVGEGPTFDDRGNLYVSPIYSGDASLISLDGATGARRWAVSGKSAGAGAPLVLDAPERPGTQAVYHILYETARAYTTDGELLWETPTGLTAPEELLPGMMDPTHNWGSNYHPAADAVLGLFVDGRIVAFHRKTGRPLLRKPYTLPGAPAMDSEKPAAWLVKRADDLLETVFGKIPHADKGLFSVLLDVLFGGGVKVANYFAVDPVTSRIFVAATAPDEADGRVDGRSAWGGLYGLELVRSQGGSWQIEVAAAATFEGGTGSTPTVSADGKRVYVGDNAGNLLAFDRDLNEIWRLPVGGQLVASVAVSAEGNELFCVTLNDILKFRDMGDHGKKIWRARLDMYPERFGLKNVNLLTPTPTANGVVVQVGIALPVNRNANIPFRTGVGILDRETGALRTYIESPEESISVSAVGPDGGVYLANSPTRRALTASLPLIRGTQPPLTGGVTRLGASDPEALALEAIRAARLRLEAIDPDPAVPPRLAQQCTLLITQALRALGPGPVGEAVAGPLNAARASLQTGPKRAAGLLREAEDRLRASG